MAASAESIYATSLAPCSQEHRFCVGQEFQSLIPSRQERWRAKLHPCDPFGTSPRDFGILKSLLLALLHRAFFGTMMLYMIRQQSAQRFPPANF